VDSDLLRGHKKSNETRLLIVAFDSLGYQESDLSQTHTHRDTHTILHSPACCIM